MNAKIVVTSFVLYALGGASVSLAQMDVRPQRTEGEAARNAGSQQIDAGPISVRVSVDRAQMRAADSVTLTLRAAAPSGVRVEMPTLEQGAKLGGFSITSTRDEPPTLEQRESTTSTTYTRHYTLEPFLPGEYTVPSLEITWRRASPSTTDAAGMQGVARTEPITINVVSLLPASTSTDPAAAPPESLDPGTIRGEYVPPVIAVSWWERWRTAIIIVGLGACAIASLAFVSVRAIRRRRAGHDVMGRVIQHLHDIRARNPAPDQTASICTSLSNALRIPMVDRFRLRAQTLTPAEMVKEIEEAVLARRRFTDTLKRVAREAQHTPVDVPINGEHELDWRWGDQGRWATDEQNQVVRTCAALLERLDTVRFSGQQLSTPELIGLIDETIDVINAWTIASETPDDDVKAVRR